MELPALALEAALAWAGCTKLCILPLNVRTLFLDYPDSEHGLSFLSSEIPNLDVCVGDFYPSSSDYLMTE